MILLSFLCAAAVPDVSDKSKWHLAFEDNFDRLDQRVWTVRGDYPRAGGYWIKSNVSVKDGSLVLRTSRNGLKMGTAAVDTRQTKLFKFGYFEVRAKIPKTPTGFRSAFWLQSPGTFSKGNAGRDGTEIDIFEVWDRDGKVEHNLHWDVERTGAKRESAGIKSPYRIGFNEWHTFGLWWTPDRYRFYIDGKLSWESTDGGVSQVPAALLLSTEALEGDMLAIPRAMLADHGDPFVIDYVKVYQTKK